MPLFSSDLNENPTQVEEYNRNVYNFLSSQVNKLQNVRFGSEV